MKKISLFLIAGLLASVGSRAQQASDNSSRVNTIKVDITSYWLYRNALVFAYERVNQAKNQSWGITAGYQLLPPFVSADSISVTREASASGLKLGGEYRWYLMKENKYAAPRGIFLGAYTAYHNYLNSRSITVDNNGTLENADLSTDFKILNIGIQLGYQFVFNDRWTLDLVFIGPSLSNYNLKATTEGNFSFDEDDVTNAFIQGLIERFPGFSELISEGEFASRGKVNKWAYGYRYQFQVGYHFGRKKK
jgi:hypothetical protein